MNKILFATLLLTSLTCQISKAIFSNSGTMRSKSSSFSADVLENTGSIEGIDCVNLQCNKLTGNGLIKGPKMEILAIECHYTGTIECSQECILITNTPQTELKFMFKGTGKLIIKSLNELK